MAVEVAPPGRSVVRLCRRLPQGGEDDGPQLGIGLEAAQPVDDLRLQWLGMGERLIAAVAMAAGRAVIAPDLPAGAPVPVHPRTAALAVEELPKQVVLGGAARLDHARPPRPDLLDPVEKVLGDYRLVQASDRAVLAAQTADIAAVGGVQQHVADGVLAEGAAAGGAGALGVQPGGQ